MPVHLRLFECSPLHFSLLFTLFLFHNRQTGPISPLPVSSVVLTASKHCCAKVSLSSVQQTYDFSVQLRGRQASFQSPNCHTKHTLSEKAESTVWDATTVITHQQHSKWKHKWFVDDALHTSWKLQKVTIGWLSHDSISEGFELFVYLWGIW